jgi:O-antigen/teichoic acid export membrane protein
MLKYGVPLAAAAIPFTLNVRVDQMIMAAFLPARSLGIYVVAVSWSGAVPLVLLAIGAVLFPRIARAEEGMRTRLLTQATRQSMFIALLLAGVFAALTPIAIPLLFGKPFAGSVRVGVVLVFAAAVLGMNIVFEEGLRGLGYTALVLWAELTGLVVTIASIAALLRPLGIMGAGIASVLGYSTTCIVLLLGICRKTHSTLADVLLLNRSDLTTARLRFASVYSLLH